jgi:Fe-S-cluster containining protein
LALTPPKLASLKNAIESGVIQDDKDNLQIANMVIHLEEYRSPESGKVEGGWYTCKNLDVETNLCTIYDDRPEMCRRYPYGKECTSCGSTCGTEEPKTVRKSGGISYDEIQSRVSG